MTQTDQVKLEYDLVSLGKSRYYQTLAEDLGCTQLGSGLITMYLSTLKGLIEKDLEQHITKKHIISLREYMDMYDLSTLEISYLVLRCALKIRPGSTMQTFTSNLGKDLLYQVRYNTFLETATPGEKWMLERALEKKKRILVGHTKGVRPPKELRLMCLYLSNLLVQVGIFQTFWEYTTTGRKTTTQLFFTKELQEYIDREHEKLSTLLPMKLPMITPPKPWTTPNNGGYLMLDYSLIRTKQHQGYRAIKTADLNKVYNGVNRLQSVGYRINQDVLKVWEHFVGLGIPIAGIPYDQEHAPEYPEVPWTDDEDKKRVKAENPKVFQSWKDVYVYLVRDRVRNQGRRQDVAMAKWFLDHMKDEEFWYTFFVDFRGRLYYDQGYINPQKPDYIKALIEFKGGKRITDPKWLYRHLSATWGHDKVTFEAREKWTTENLNEIIAVANDPIGNQWWTEAEEPFQFLAGCFDLQGYLRDPDNHLSHLIVYIDGTCNGLQHYAALFRDSLTGKYVNLIDSGKPMDLYAKVAKETTASLRTKGDEIAALWLNVGIDRALVKRVVMTTAYGVTLWGCKDQIYEEISSRNTTSHRYLGTSSINDRTASNYLGKVLYDSLSEVIVSATSGMKWLKKVSNCKKEQPLVWTTPSGFKVQQAYKETDHSYKSIKYMGKVVKLNYRDYNKHISQRKQSQGLPPNFIHSLDAAHMMLMLNRLDPSVDVVPIHDSFGCHVCDVDKLQTSLRTTFYEMYKSNDILDRFIEELGIEDPPPFPKQGDLKLEQILKSPYFFN